MLSYYFFYFNSGHGEIEKKHEENQKIDIHLANSRRKTDWLCYLIRRSINTEHMHSSFTWNYKFVLFRGKFWPEK